ncbi:MAG: A24 family peptidase [Clostridiales bacterium]|nr:A24 family peptidase [Clostridiales bacterium]
MKTAIYLLIFIAGACTGLFLLRIAVTMIRQRAGNVDHFLITSKKAPVLWALITGTGYLTLTLVLGIRLETAESIYFYSLVLILSAVDYIIRKIPNEILLAIFIGAVGFLILGNSFSDIKDHLLGLITGTGVFLLPFLMGRRAGAGDLKYAATIGFCLGMYYTLLAFVIMAAFYFLYVSYLLISKKGTFQTMTALGPYMSLGFLLASVWSGTIY